MELESNTAPKTRNFELPSKYLGEKAPTETQKYPKTYYNARLPRKTVASLCGLSNSGVANLENIGLIKGEREKYGAMEIATYSLEDVHKIFAHRKIGFKNKEAAEVICIFSQKGGVGKSAFTQQLGSTMSMMGKTLIIDLDAQSDSTILFGGEKTSDDLVIDEDFQPTIAELIDWSLKTDEEAPYDRMAFDDVAIRINPYLDLIPATLDLGEINYSLNRYPLKDRVSDTGEVEPGEIHVIREVIEPLRSKYDYILVDCAPNIETCNVAALYAADRVLIPIEMEAKTFAVMKRNVEFLWRLSELNDGFDWEKILLVPNKYMSQLTIKRKALDKLKDEFKGSTFAHLSKLAFPQAVLIDKLADLKMPSYVATSKFTPLGNGSTMVATEFSNYFWTLAHEILDLEVPHEAFSNSRRRAFENMEL